MPVNNLTSTNLTTGHPIQSVVPAFAPVFVLTATNIASAAAGFGVNKPVLSKLLPPSNMAAGAAGLGAPSFNQGDAFTATNLATQAAVLTNASTQSTTNFNSAANYGNTSPVLDTAVPTLTLSSAYNFTAASIASVAAGFDQPATNQFQVITAANLVSGAASISIPQFVQFNLLIATDIASSAAVLGTPSSSTLTIILNPQSSFISIDSSINVLNAALIGATSSASMLSMANVAMQGKSTLASVAGLNALSSIIITDQALLVNSTSLAATVGIRKSISTLMASTITALRANALTVIFENKTLSAIAALNTALAQNYAAGAAASSAAALVAATPSINQSAVLTLSSSATMLANIIKPVSQQWAASALLSPAPLLISNIQRIINESFTFRPTTGLGASAQVYAYATTLLPSSTLRALAGIVIPNKSALSSTTLMTALERELVGAASALTAVSTISITSLVMKGIKTALSASTTLTTSLAMPRSLVASLTAQTVMPTVAVLIGRVASHLTSAAVLTSVESYRMALLAGMTPVTSLTNHITGLSLPRVLWNAQTALAVNERVLPSGTSFYFAVTQIAVLENIRMASKASAALQTQLISHEGVRMLQPPTVASASAVMAGIANAVHGPVLRIPSNIVLSAKATNYEAVRAALSSLTDFKGLFSHSQILAAGISNGSTLSASSHMRMAGTTSLGPRCYINPVMGMQRTVESGTIITARKSRARIVAQGSLVRRYE